jgi:ssDNA-binding Zn-finger/Zn-ribbon topoisomerase 1
VKKEGKNAGKTFYGCHVYPPECEFFKWEEKKAPRAPSPELSQPATQAKKKMKIVITGKVELLVDPEQVVISYE